LVSKSSPGDSPRYAWVGRAKQYTQPCSQPRYGFTDLSNGTSGESLVAMIDWIVSSVTVVAGAGRGSSAPSSPQPSSNAARANAA
jgi:hypothetical protein